jgi:hypothetical protein
VKTKHLEIPVGRKEGKPGDKWRETRYTAGSGVFYDLVLYCIYYIFILSFFYPFYFVLFIFIFLFLNHFICSLLYICYLHDASYRHTVDTVDLYRVDRRLEGIGPRNENPSITEPKHNGSSALEGPSERERLWGIRVTLGDFWQVSAGWYARYVYPNSLGWYTCRHRLLWFYRVLVDNIDVEI